MMAVGFCSTSDAQAYRTLGTRRGAIAGAIIGGIAGAQNDEALAGVAIGGLVGGVAGRVIGNNIDQNQFRGNNQTYYAPQRQYYAPQQQFYSQPRVQTYSTQQFYTPSGSTFHNGYHGGHYGTPVYRAPVYGNSGNYRSYHFGR